MYDTILPVLLQVLCNICSLVTKVTGYHPSYAATRGRGRPVSPPVLATLSHSAGLDDLTLENVTEAEIRSGKMEQFLLRKQSGNVHHFVSSL